MSNPIFAIHDLTIETSSARGHKRLVEAVDLSVHPGEIYGVVGETGSGKSISMMASVGLAARGLKVVRGTVQFGGETIAAERQRLLRRNLANGVSLLFQNAKGALNPFLRTAKQVERVLATRGFPAQKRPHQIRTLFEAVGLDLDEIGPKYAHEISGGQAQRVAIACALATDPQLLIADEPTTALDVTTEREVLIFLQQLCRQRNMALILIAHNLALVAEYCTRLSILHAGHVVESGPVADLFAWPMHPYTQGLIAAIPDVDNPRELEPLAGTVWGGGPMLNRCRFAHRCPHVLEICQTRIPNAIHYNEHMVRCVLYDGQHQALIPSVKPISTQLLPGHPIPAQVSSDEGVV
jgi:oligopeptide/dipeptide ABC transporter ATP-binding protein